MKDMGEDKVERPTRSPSRIRTEMERLERLYEQGRFLGKKYTEYLMKMNRLAQELREAKELREEFEKKVKDAGFDGRTGSNPLHEYESAMSLGGISSWQYYHLKAREIERENQKRKKKEERAKRLGFDSVEAMEEEEWRQFYRDEALRVNACPACEGQIPCNCGWVDDSDNMSRNTKFGSNL